MIQTMTDWADAAGLLAVAVGLAYIVGHSHGFGWGAITFGTVILCVSAVLAALSRRGKGGAE